MNSKENNTRVKVPNHQSSVSCVILNGAHEAESPNPSKEGRDSADFNTSRRISLLQCRSNSIISTINTRTITQKFKRDDLAHKLLESEIDILGVQEYRLVHEEMFRYEQNHKTLLITTPAWRNEMGAANGGVGILLGPKAAKSCSNVNLLVNEYSESPSVEIHTYCSILTN